MTQKIMAVPDKRRVVKDGVVVNPGTMAVYLPSCSGCSDCVKWFDDMVLVRVEKEGERNGQ